MEIRISLKRDSDNSYPESTLVVQRVDDDEICLKISDCEREVTVKYDELSKAISIM